VPKLFQAALSIVEIDQKSPCMLIIEPFLGHKIAVDSEIIYVDSLCRVFEQTWVICLV